MGTPNKEDYWLISIIILITILVCLKLFVWEYYQVDYGKYILWRHVINPEVYDHLYR